MLGMRAEDPVAVLVWVAVVFVSILVHELGHAFMQRSYRGHPWITLYGLGGLASCNDCSRSPWAQILISLAGPMAGFLFAALIMLGLGLTGHQVGFLLPRQIGEAPDGAFPRSMGLFVVYFQLVKSFWGNVVIDFLLQVNILWGLVNLLPVYPLDGGHIARELFTLGNPRAGIIQSLQLSCGVAVLLAAYAILKQDVFLCLMFGYLAYSSFQTLQAYRNHWR
jgi:Zn-dependent protease